MPADFEAEDHEASILRLLAEPDRLRVVAALVLGYERPSEVASATGIEERNVGRALARLAAGGLVLQTGDGAYRFAIDELRNAVRRAPTREEELHVSAEARLLKVFFKGDRLMSIPASHSKRLVILDRLAQVFEPGRRYREREVNTALARFHNDVATLRRYLVDEGFMTRAAGFYWRSGGTYPVE